MNVFAVHSGEWPKKLVSLDKTHLAVGFISTDDKLGKTIRMFNWQTGGEFGKLIGHTRDVGALAKLEDGYLASGSRDTNIKIWQWTSGKVVRNLTGHTNLINDLLPIVNFSQIISCANEMTIKVWNRSNGRVMKTLLGYSDWVKSVVMLKNGLFATASTDTTIGIWNLTEEVQIQK
jgi:WD40 repeat protein